MEFLIVEAVKISYFTKGGFTFSDIKNLDFGDYERLLKEADRIQQMSIPKDEQ